MRTPKKVEVYPWTARIKASRGRTDAGWYWIARCYHKGETYQKSRRHPGRDHCARWLEALGRPWEWTDPADEEDEAPLTVRELLTAYIESRPEGSTREHEGHVRRRWERLSPALYRAPVDALDTAALAAHVAAELEAGHATRTIRQSVTLARAAMRWGAAQGLDVIVPPAPTIPATGDRWSRHTPSEGAVMDVAEHLLAGGSPWTGYAVLLLWCWGCRPGELGGLTWGRVWTAERIAVVDGKTGPREIPLSDDALALLDACRALPDRRDWRTVLGVRPGTARTMVSAAVRGACGALGQRPWTPQALRRAATDRLYESGADPAVEAALLGHSERTAMAHYRQVRARQARQTMERLGTLPQGRVLVLKRREAEERDNGQATRSQRRS